MRWVDTELDRPRLRATFNYRLHSRLQLGVEINPEADEVGPLLTWFLLTEDDRRPALFFGTSSDRIGSPEGEQAYFLTASKRHPAWPVSAYVSLNYSEWDEDFNFPFGAELYLGDSFSVRPMYDGQRTHLTMSYRMERQSVTLLWVWLERVGIAYSLRF